MGRAKQQASSGPSDSRRRTSIRGISARGRHNSRRASMFRRSNRITELIDELGNRTCEVQEGRMNTASHDQVLQALKYRANWFKGKRKHHGVDDRTFAWALDKTAIINTLQILSVKETCEKYLLIEQQEIDRVRELGLSDEVLWVHGVALVNNPSHLQECEWD